MSLKYVRSDFCVRTQFEFSRQKYHVAAIFYPKIRNLNDFLLNFRRENSNLYSFHSIENYMFLA